MSVPPPVHGATSWPSSSSSPGTVPTPPTETCNSTVWSPPSPPPPQHQQGQQPQKEEQVRAHKTQVQCVPGPFRYNGRVFLLLLVCLPAFTTLGDTSLLVSTAGIGFLIAYALDFAGVKSWTLASVWLTLGAIQFWHMDTLLSSFSSGWFSLVSFCSNSALLMLCGLWATLQFRFVQEMYPDFILKCEQLLVVGLPLVSAPLVLRMAEFMAGNVYQVPPLFSILMLIFTAPLLRPLRSSFLVSNVYHAEQELHVMRSADQPASASSGRRVVVGVDRDEGDGDTSDDEESLEIDKTVPTCQEDCIQYGVGGRTNTILIVYALPVLVYLGVYLSNTAFQLGKVQQGVIYRNAGFSGWSWASLGNHILNLGALLALSQSLSLFLVRPNFLLHDMVSAFRHSSSRSISRTAELVSLGACLFALALWFEIRVLFSSMAVFFVGVGPVQRTLLATTILLASGCALLLIVSKLPLFGGCAQYLQSKRQEWGPLSSALLTGLCGIGGFSGGILFGFSTLGTLAATLCGACGCIWLLHRQPIYLYGSSAGASLCLSQFVLEKLTHISYEMRSSFGSYQYTIAVNQFAWVLLAMGLVCLWSLVVYQHASDIRNSRLRTRRAKRAIAEQKRPLRGEESTEVEEVRGSALVDRSSGAMDALLGTPKSSHGLEGDVHVAEKALPWILCAQAFLLSLCETTAMIQPQAMYPMYFFVASFFCGLFFTLHLRKKKVISFHTSSVMIGLYGCKFAVLLGQELVPLSLPSMFLMILAFSRMQFALSHEERIPTKQVLMYSLGMMVVAFLCRNVVLAKLFSFVVFQASPSEWFSIGAFLVAISIVSLPLSVRFLPHVTFIKRLQMFAVLTGLLFLWTGAASRDEQGVRVLVTTVVAICASVVCLIPLPDHPAVHLALSLVSGVAVGILTCFSVFQYVTLPLSLAVGLSCLIAIMCLAHITFTPSKLFLNAVLGGVAVSLSLFPCAFLFLWIAPESTTPPGFYREWKRQAGISLCGLYAAISMLVGLACKLKLSVLEQRKRDSRSSTRAASSTSARVSKNVMRKLGLVCNVCVACSYVFAQLANSAMSSWGIPSEGGSFLFAAMFLLLHKDSALAAGLNDENRYITPYVMSLVPLYFSGLLRIAVGLFHGWSILYGIGSFLAFGMSTPTLLLLGVHLIVRTTKNGQQGRLKEDLPPPMAVHATAVLSLLSLFLSSLTAARLLSLLGLLGNAVLWENTRKHSLSNRPLLR